MRGQIAPLGQRSDAKPLTLLLKELLQWAATLPKETQDTVAQKLAATGLSHLLRVDDQRIKRVLKRGAISTASEYRAVQGYLERSHPGPVEPGALEQLGAILAHFDLQKRGSSK
jgi:hypothetical protein